MGNLFRSNLGCEIDQFLKIALFKQTFYNNIHQRSTSAGTQELQEQKKFITAFCVEETVYSKTYSYYRGKV